jgi:hypothetical protein
MHADGSIHLNLSSTTVDEQLDTRDVGAVVGSKEHRRFAQIIRRLDTAERNGSNDRGFFFIRHEMRKAWRIGVSGAQHVDADVAPLEVDDPGTGERAYRGLRGERRLPTCRSHRVQRETIGGF